MDGGGGVVVIVPLLMVSWVLAVDLIAINIGFGLAGLFLFSIVGEVVEAPALSPHDLFSPLEPKPSARTEKRIEP
ncbi:hypothetical protein RHGRI_035627 [Rhododendron griersonianum]|uniref:Uncharacterized protein n=1 Tax=Rhododendron griersonianum TaxID=479676 RepID=A0AAV6HJT6_9ERIC|nr:hypothetical protein RHGRI_035627 [Rhododendron griersonianum]